METGDKVTGMVCSTTEERYLPQVLHLEQRCTFKSTGDAVVRFTYYGGSLAPGRSTLTDSTSARMVRSGRCWFLFIAGRRPSWSR